MPLKKNKAEQKSQEVQGVEREEILLLYRRWSGKTSRMR